MSKTLRPKRIVLRIADPLQAEIDAAAAEGRQPADVVRRVLVEWAGSVRLPIGNQIE
jgi:hypothetical protein